MKLCNRACDSPAEVCHARLQKGAVDPTRKSGLASQRRRSPIWALRDEYEFAGLEWGRSILGRGTRECGRHGHGTFREQWGLLAGGGVRESLRYEGGEREGWGWSSELRTKGERP